MTKPTYKVETIGDDVWQVFGTMACGQRFLVASVSEAQSFNPIVEFHHPLGLHGVAAVVEAIHRGPRGAKLDISPADLDLAIWNRYSHRKQGE